MSIILDPKESAITRGIKTVGVGKKGSKALGEDLASEILNDLKADKISSAAKGAFFAGLLAKGLEPYEKALLEAVAPGALEDSRKLVEVIAGDASAFARWVCVHLLENHTLDKKTAYDLGRFLFSDEPGNGARGLVASILRVRYETDDEYEGLLQALLDTVDPTFNNSVLQGEPLVQLAEPFDGVDHSYMITPLVARYIQSLGYRALHMVGKNSGPKWEMNLWDIASSLKEGSIQNAADLALSKPSFGWFCYQNNISQAIERWHLIRKQTIKRPFMSTIERFLNPFKADIIIASAFHPPYGQKMLTLAQRAGFKGIVIVRNGLEGTIAFPLLRPVKLLLSGLGKDGQYHDHEMTLDTVGGVDSEQMVEHPRAKDNAVLIENFLKEGSSGNVHFDLRLKATCEGLEKALQWLNAHASC